MIYLNMIINIIVLKYNKIELYLQIFCLIITNISKFNKNISNCLPYLNFFRLGQFKK